MTKIVKKGSKLPVRKHKFFKPDTNTENILDIKIFQGERELVKDNYLIGKFDFNLMKKNKDNVIIKITIEVNVNGIITIKANERGNNHKKD